MPRLETFNKTKPINRLEKEAVFEFYAPQAEDLRIAGTFNNWDATKHRLRKDSNGCWRLALRLKQGRYEYRYLVDGNWENDQRPCACVPNAFGTWNCVIEIS